MTLGLLFASFISPFFFDTSAEVRTAYQTRGKVVEDRPMQITHVRTGWDTGDFGKIGFRLWAVSSLTGSRQNVHQRAFNETDPGVFWNYGWKLDEDGKWKLVTEVMKDWILLNGYTEPYHAKGTDDPVDEWRVGNSLENPYVTPYWLMRRGINEKDWVYFQVGARRRFALTETLYLSVDYYVELGNRRLHEIRNGSFADGREYSNGIQSSVLNLQLGWQATDWLDVFAGVHQFDVLSARGREACDDHNANCGRKDLTIGTVGVRVRF